MRAPQSPLDLSRSRNVGELLGETLRLFRSHLSLFLTASLIVVAPVTLLVEGLWGRQLANGTHAAETSSGAATVSTLLYALVVPPLAMTLHMVILAQLSRRETPALGRVLREAAPRLPAALGTVIIYTAGIALGYLLFILPGIWLTVRWYLAIQCAIAQGTAPSDSLRASAQLVRGRWWLTLGTLLAAAILFGLPAAILDAIARSAHSGFLYVTLEIIIESAVISLTAIYGSLVYFSWRAQPPAARPR